MYQMDSNSTRRQRLWLTLTITAVMSFGTVMIALPGTAAADPEPAPPPNPAAVEPSPNPVVSPTAPGTAAAVPPNVPSDAPHPMSPSVDPNVALPPVVDPNVPASGRVNNAVGGFSFVVPGGWAESDASHLDYGSALLSKVTGGPPQAGQPPAVATDTRIVLGRLDEKLYASAEVANSNAATRLGSDMGEFFMPYPGTRINQETIPLNANGVAGSASYYEVDFSDQAKPSGQIWTGVIGSPASNTPNAGPPQRWFVVWLGAAANPVDKNAVKILAESIRPWTPAPPPDDSAAPAQAPAGEVTGPPAPTRTLPA